MIRRAPQNLILALVLVLGTTSVASCNTIRGAGRDVSATGDAVSRSAAQVQADIMRNRAKQDAKDARYRAKQEAKDARDRRAAERRAARGS